MSELHTYRDNTVNPLVPDKTVWTYDPGTGLLTSKTDADNKSVTYTYDSSNRLLTRSWARLVETNPLVTTYGYNSNTGELTTVDYSDSTPDITYTYNRLGQQKTVTDAVGTRTFAYNDALQPLTETITGLYSKVITRSYEGTGMIGRYKGIDVKDTPVDAIHYDVDYGYDTMGRFSTVTNGSDVYTYNYLANSNLVSSITYPNTITVTNAYESNRNLIDYVENKHGSTSISKYDYTNDALGRRTAMAKSGTAFSATDTIAYGYNHRSEVTSATSANDSTYNFSFNFDAIGNRKDYTTNETGSSVQSLYTTNNLNQYTSITNPVQSPVYDDDGSLISDGKFTYEWNAENRLISVISTEDPSDLDYVKLEFKYDYMGRRVNKKVWKWVREEAPIVIPPEVQEQIDAVNAQREKKLTQEAEQLEKMLTHIDNKIAKILEKKKGNWEKQIEVFEKQKEHEQEKTVAKNETINTNADAQIAQIYEDAGIDPDDIVEGDPVWMLAEDANFVYDGYKKIETLDSLNSNAITKKNVWSGETLLSENDGTDTYYAVADANKNITEYLDSTGDIRAHYEYSPFGKITYSDGDMADDFKYRFSSEYFDSETKLVYYNYRYYSPELGRWLSRDPAEESGGTNLYGFVENEPISQIDYHGLFRWTWRAKRYTNTLPKHWNEYRNKQKPKPKGLGGLVTNVTQVIIKYCSKDKKCCSLDIKGSALGGWWVMRGYTNRPVRKGSTKRIWQHEVDHVKIALKWWRKLGDYARSLLIDCDYCYKAKENEKLFNDYKKSSKKAMKKEQNTLDWNDYKKYWKRQ